MATKKQREALAAQFDGRCAFCGCKLGKGWHVWDIEPIVTIVSEGGNMQTLNDNDESNLLPACKPCGSLRIVHPGRKMTIEEFRKEVYKSFWFLREGGITRMSYGRSLRFGLIKETGNPVKFYFEVLNEFNTIKQKVIPKN